MQLKEIILKGFKSFPDKTVLEFDEGVTAIVGPNGSGKSNIIEAIRWVMGEQSAKTLRGDRMNDVIFSGTRERKPINIAEVELILDNSNGYLDIEYDELSILRRLSRNGQSTYMINKKECRLKDIVDLFMDSGLGKESFSVISQGEVEAIFNSKPEDRRGIFEEAAGVFKYKVQKEDAKKKLGETQENLDRVQDILYELEAQLEPLNKQAAIAKSYLEHRDKLTDLDIALSVKQIQDLAAEVTEDKEKQQSVMKDLEQIDCQINELDEKKEYTQAELIKYRSLSEQLNEELVKVVREKERLEASLNLFDEKSRHQEEFIQVKQHSIQELEQQNAKQKSELAAIEKNYTIQKKKLGKINSKIDDLEARRRYLEGDKNVQMEDLRSQYIEHLQKQSSLKNDQSRLEQELTRNQIEKDRVEKKVAELKAEVEQKERELREKQEAFEEISEDLAALVSEHQESAQQLKRIKHISATLTQELAHETTELERVRARALSLNEMKENYAGYYAGVRAVMQEKNKLSGIVGTVAELITIPAKYLQAINTVLGGSGQFVVVEDEKNARAAINYLKNNRRGRATFLPLTTIRPRQISQARQESLKNMPGYLGLANELVSNNQKVQNIIDNLLGQTIVANSLEEANAIARSIQFSHRVVSLEGDVMNAGGSMTGGGQQNNLNPIFSQKAELAKLESFLAENEQAFEELQAKQKQTAAEQIRLERKVEEIRLAGEEKRLTEQYLNGELSNLKEQLHRFKRELEASSFEEKDKQDLGETYQQDLQETEKSLQEIEKIVASANESMHLLTSEQETIDAERVKISTEISEVQEKRNALREDLAREKIKIEHAQEQIRTNNQQIKKLQADIQSFDGEFELGSKEDLQELFEKRSKQEKDLELKQLESRENIQKITEELDELTNSITQLSGRHKYLSGEKGKIDIRLSKNDVRTDYLLDYLIEEYKISYEEARLREPLTIELADAKKQVKLLKKGIEELGPVNLNSIEESASVNERYAFLAEQQDDLVQAKETLFNTMDDMDLIVEKYFKETFDRVQVEFSKVFPKMFGGGYAELVLSDPDNLLETGIEIIAQPPGKRLTQLSLLSGGERALTAISLLFAIIQVNPIPFCILDEAEAALDDANVVRFGEYLKNFENNTQFIVITHRKGTMEHSDQLYGITMQEKGISKIVGVSLKEAQEIEGLT